MTARRYPEAAKWLSRVDLETGPYAFRGALKGEMAVDVKLLKIALRQGE